MEITSLIPANVRMSEEGVLEIHLDRERTVGPGVSASVYMD